MAEQLQGILPLLKPAGMTSHDCVARLRKLLKTKKVGHTGTLDPEVSGVLPICIGRATKVAQYMSDYPKAYEAEVTVGWSTTTEDAHGEKVEEQSVPEGLELVDVVRVASSFVGEIKQVPPMYSAVKVNGKKLYQYAREGIEVERPVRQATIFELSVTTTASHLPGPDPTFSFFVSCSKGTYIRTLAVDMGKALGYPAHMSHLRRTSSGPFKLEDCLTFEEIEERIAADQKEALLLPLETAIAHFGRITVDEETEAKVRNGSVLPLPKEVQKSPFGVYNKNGTCLALYKVHPDKPDMMKPEKVLAVD
ncbi:tRNA pseudouridine 5S synthase [Fictibacillus macauensis ZFHKF-1]|uniref:tRNA pseudouridine synthase B n=1 Tax=Fictibacillus macauensis ZFHKF-1 TaxID=1196324 RepID=I8UE96_9BACL|nr:tRNA pseudouridine(55) synthase TruB [Fictibacillus macauensis]EIT85123.1 tRNA pseudouridine 5S synthase [Fictibacillus macauensis ZFHKF-1]